MGKTGAPELLIHIVAPFAFAYLLSYLIRVVNAVAGPAIANDLGVDAASLGFLTSVYFLTFASAQLPLGVALDRYGPRRVQALLLIIAAAGAAIFAISTSTLGLAVGRGLMGLGFAGCLMGAFKAYAMNLPHERLPLVNGTHMAAGGLGALLGGAPSEWAIGLLGWRGLFAALGILTVLSAVLIATIARDRTAAVHPPSNETVREQFASLRRIMGDGTFLRMAAFIVPSHATFLALLGLWAGPWLRDVGGYSADAAALALSGTAAALIAGFLGFGAIATRLARAGSNPMVFALALTVLFTLTQVALIALPSSSGAGVWFLFALFGTAGILPFPVLAAHFPRAFAGRVNTAMNFLVFVTSFVVQWLVGVGLDAFTPTLGVKGAYDAVLAILLVLEFAGIAVLLARFPKRPTASA